MVTIRKCQSSLPSCLKEPPVLYRCGFVSLAWAVVCDRRCVGPTVELSSRGLYGRLQRPGFHRLGGPVENYEVQDGAILCKPGKGGTIYTTRTPMTTSSCAWNSNCRPAATTAWRSAIPVPAIPPMSGCASCRCSIPSIPSMPSLDARQYHGSAYGMVRGPRGATCGPPASGTSRR